jgi:membrane-bound lytic murein transglycosylase D
MMPAAFLSLPTPAFCQSGALLSLIAARAKSLEEIRLDEAENPSIPQEMLDLMRKAQGYYLEGSDLLKSGEAERARACFDSAVGLLLQSKWSLTSTPDLNNFFQDLIGRIKRDESLYLRPPQPPEDQPEGAVLDELEKVDLIPIQVDPSLQDVVEADILATKYDIPIILNESVLKSLNYWLSRGRRYFTDGLVRSGRYREMIQEVFQAAALPLDLMYLAQVESLFKTNAISRASARGMWQFSRGTAIRYGLKVNRQIDERMDPEKSTRAAALYLKDLWSMFQDWNLVLAAYNWGEGKVQWLMDRYGKDDFWDLVKLRRSFPRETRNHVPLILSSVILARNPDKYGLPVELDPPLRSQSVRIPKPTSLSAIAKTLGADLDTLKKLNPALKITYTPANYPDFELRIPADTDPALVAQLGALPAVKSLPSQPFNGRHRIRSGDTLWSIAAQYGTTVAALQDANDIQSPKSLRVGSWLEVPIRRTPAAPPAAKGKTKGPQVVRAPQKPDED